MRSIPRTCPSIRWSRFWSWSLVALYPRVSVWAMPISLPHTSRGYSGPRARHDRRRPVERLPDGLGGLVGARARLLHIRGGPVLGTARAHPVRAERRRREAGRARDRARRRVVVLLLRRGGDRQVAVPEGRFGRVGARLPVRLDQPGLGARPGSVDPDRLAVHAGRVPGRRRDDLADVGAPAGVRPAPRRGGGARARPRGR